MLHKGLFYGLYLCAIALFAATTISLLVTAGTEIKTTTNIQMRDEITFPTGFFCFYNEKIRQDTQEMSVTNGNIIEDTGKTNQCKGNPSGDGVNPQLAVTKTNWGDFTSTESCIDMLNGTPFLAHVQNMLSKLNTVPGEDPPIFSCSSINEDGALKDSSSNPLSIQVIGNWAVKASASQSDLFSLYMGFVSPDQLKAARDKGNDFAGVLSQFQYQKLDLFNTETIVQHSVDQILDLSNEFEFRPTTAISEKDHKDKLENIYSTYTSTAKIEAIPRHDLLGNTDSPKLYSYIVNLRTSTFFVREVLKRKASFEEVWAGIGGCWSTALLIVALFFSQQTVQKGGVMQYTHIFNYQSGDAAAAQIKEYEGRYAAPAADTQRNHPHSDGVEDDLETQVPVVSPSA